MPKAKTPTDDCPNPIMNPPWPESVAIQRMVHFGTGETPQ